VYGVTVELALAISNDNATYETQFGWVQRPTHKNTTWDMANLKVRTLLQVFFWSCFLFRGGRRVVEVSAPGSVYFRGGCRRKGVGGEKDAGKADFLFGVWQGLAFRSKQDQSGDNLAASSRSSSSIRPCPTLLHTIILSFRSSLS
jgi:hypothetical protein